MGKVIEVAFEGRVKIEINDDDVIERVTGMGGDLWRSYAYNNIRTVEDIAEHFAYNAVVNGQQHVDHLDGWADLPREAVTMTVQVDPGNIDFLGLR